MDFATIRPRPVRSLWPLFEEADIEAVAQILRSGKINAWTGPHVAAFEEAYAAHLGRTQAIALTNGTAALEVALHALGIGPGDEVVVSPRSFFASAACVPFVGATPVFADVDPDSQNLTADTIAAVLGPRTRAVIVVHHAGWPADMPAIMALARARGFAVIEDCAQAHGAEIAGRRVGAFGDVAAFSFCQDKIISTGGEGGLVAMDDPEVFRRAWSRKDHGKCFDRVHAQHPPGFRWLHTSFGTNLRMTSAQAALGSAQLARLDETRARRTENAVQLMDSLEQLPGLRVPRLPSDARHAYYRVYAFIRPSMLRVGWTRDRILAAITEQAVPCFVGSCPEIYEEAAFRGSGFAPRERLPVAQALGTTSLAFPVDPTLDRSDIAIMAAAVGQVMAEATSPPSTVRSELEVLGSASWS